MKIIAALFLWLFSLVAYSSTLIDFADVPQGPAPLLITSGGFEFQYLDSNNGNLTNPFVGIGTNSGAWPASNYSVCLGCTSGPVGFVFSEATGAAFSLESFLYGDAGFVEDSGGSLSITGTLVGGGTVTETVNFGVFFAETLTFDEKWSNLVDVEIVVAANVTTLGALRGIAFSNIEVSVVPIPATAWLFMSALAVAGFTRCARRPRHRRG